MPGPLTRPPVQHGSGSKVTQPTAQNDVNAAADRWHVPRWLLWGVYGIETSFGTNVTTSSAGAIGPFQFLPSTAAGYHYPLTNQPNVTQFRQQADAAAHYLSDLYRRTGSWDAALRAYSGGGYGENQAREKANSPEAKDWAAATRPGSLARGAQDAAGAVGDALSVPGKFLGLVTNPQTWLRLVEIVVGVALLLLALRSFTGGSVDPVGRAARAFPAGRVARAAWGGKGAF